MKQPTRSERTRLVGLLARYILADGTHINVQEKTYRTYMRYFETLETRYPHVAFRSEDTQRSLTTEAIRKARQKVFRGPGSTS